MAKPSSTEPPGELMETTTSSTSASRAFNWLRTSTSPQVGSVKKNPSDGVGEMTPLIYTKPCFAITTKVKIE